MEEQAKQTRWVTAIAVVGTVAVGVLGMIGALISYLNQDTSGFGVCVLGSAVAFGMLANAVLRN